MELIMDFDWSSEQLAIYNEIKSFAKRELNDNILERDNEGKFSWEGWKKCAETGILGLPIPKEYGGAGADILTTIFTMEALGYGCRDNGLVHSINSHLWGCVIPILKFGTDKQKQTYLPDLSKGELVGGHAVTEPDAGSDVFSLKSSAIKKGNYYIINGSKSIVSNAPIADIIIVFAATAPDKGFLGGVSAFIVSKKAVGLKVGKPLEKMGLNTSPISELFFDDCKIPVSSILGSEGSVTRIFQETMEWERSCLFACHIGATQRILETCVRYAKDRKQFGQSIGKFQSISNKIARIKMNLELGKLILYKLGWLKEQNKNIMLETSIAKLFISENLKSAAMDAVQIHGFYGYMKEMGIEKELRDAIPATI
jgi:alkylation response protein AidB-like acyl-CoA dehydrogenase